MRDRDAENERCPISTLRSTSPSTTDRGQERELAVALTVTILSAARFEPQPLEDFERAALATYRRFGRADLFVDTCPPSVIPERRARYVWPQKKPAPRTRRRTVSSAPLER